MTQINVYIPYSRTERLNSVKMTILKLIYRINAIHIKILADFLKKDFIFFLFLPKAPPVHSCIFFVVGSSSCGMWDAASAWFDEQCHVRVQDSNQRNTGLPAAEHENLTARPRG